MPDLARFWREERRDDLAIITVHDSSVESFDELDEGLRARGVEELWGGLELPFPVLLDATGETFEAHAIELLPTTLLIDPEGNFHGEVSGVDELRRILEREEAARRPADR
ncbi:MAG: TlpA disulfide reductase family protein [Planctomycetota bacterium]